MSRILFTIPQGNIRDTYFPAPILQRLSSLGEVVWNSSPEPMSESALAEALPGVEICLTHWGSPAFTPAVLAAADRLKLIAHCAGTVADLVNLEVYEKGIQVVSANPIMARYTAEGAFALILSGLRRLHQQARAVEQLGWQNQNAQLSSLFGARVGLIGLGAVGRHLLAMLQPFNPSIRVYDPYLDPTSLPAGMQIQPASLDEVLSWAEVLSLHASLSDETRGMLGAEQLARLEDGALLVNTARGALIDETALAEELRSGRLSAMLDVYAAEPLPLDSPLRGLPNVVLLPHSAASVKNLTEMSAAMLDEVERFLHGEPLQYPVSYTQYSRMTREKPFSIYRR